MSSVSRSVSKAGSARDSSAAARRDDPILALGANPAATAPALRRPARLCGALALLTLGAALTAAVADAAEPAAVRGLVLDPQGAPLSAATVTIEELSAATVSDHAGRFAFGRVPLGSYTLRASHVRFAPVTTIMRVAGAQPDTAVLRFQSESPVLLDETVITATRTPRILSEAPLPVSVITREQINTFQAETIAPVLEQLPGVTQMPNGFARSSVSIHGLPEQYALLLINGQRQYGRHAGAKDMEHISTDAIEQVEVVKGPSSVLYGSDAVAGVINVITRDGMREPALNLYAAGGSQDSYTLRANGGGTALAWQHHLAGSWNASDFMGEGYGYTNMNLRLSSNRTLRQGHRVQVQAGYFDEQTEDMPATEDYAGGSYLDDEVMDVRAGWSWEPSNVSHWQASAGYYDQYRRDGRPGRDARIWERSNYVGDVQHTTRLGAHSLTGGAEIRLDNIDYTLIASSRDQTLIAAFAQDEWRWTDAVTLVAAARVERHDRWGTVAVPRVGLSVRPSASVVARLSGGTSFRAPALTDLYETEYYHPWGGGFWLGGNANLDPEESVGANLDVEYRGRAMALSGGLFYNRLSDRISQGDTGRMIDDKPVRQLINSEEAETWGAEFQARWVPLRNLRTTTGYTYLQTEDKATGLDFDYAPEHTVDVALTWEPSGRGLTLGAHGKYLGSRYASASAGRELDAAYVLDVHAAKQVASGVSLFAAVENALDEQLYWESRYFSDEYRRLRAGLRYRM